MHQRALCVLVFALLAVLEGVLADKVLYQINTAKITYTGAVKPADTKYIFGESYNAANQADTSIVKDSDGTKWIRTTLRKNTIHSIPSGKANGIANFPPLSEKTHDEATVSYNIRFSSNFDWSLGGKLPGLEGVAPGVSVGKPTGGKGDPKTTGWSGRLMWLTSKAYKHAGTPNMISSYMYHPGQATQYGDDVWWETRFVAGKSHQVKVRYVMNTVGKSNGILQAWLDGKLVVNRANFVYRTNSAVHITNLCWHIFRGGNTISWAGAVDNTVDIRNLVVTTPTTPSTKASYDPTVCSNATASTSWTTVPFDEQNSVFTATLSVTPSASNINSVFGLSSGVQGIYQNYSALFRFYTSGIQAYNGATSAYAAENTVSYTPNTLYVLSMTVNVPDNTYSVSVKVGDSETPITIATDFKFRVPVSTLDTYGFLDQTAGSTYCVWNVGPIADAADTDDYDLDSFNATVEAGIDISSVDEITSSMETSSMESNSTVSDESQATTTTAAAADGTTGDVAAGTTGNAASTTGGAVVAIKDNLVAGSSAVVPATILLLIAVVASLI